MDMRAQLWVAPTGLRLIDDEVTRTSVPTAALARDGVSFLGIGLYGEVLSFQGKPIDVFADALDDLHDIRTAVDELVMLGYLKIVDQPGLQR